MNLRATGAAHIRKSVGHTAKEQQFITREQNIGASAENTLLSALGHQFCE